MMRACSVPLTFAFMPEIRLDLKMKASFQSELYPRTWLALTASATCRKEAISRILSPAAEPSPIIIAITPIRAAPSSYDDPVRAIMPYYVYLIRSIKDGRWYTGFTVDIRKRLGEHNEGIYYEMCKNKEDARKREIYLKTGMGRRYLKNRLKRFLALTG